MTELDSIVKRLGIHYMPHIESDEDYDDTVLAIIYCLETHPDKQKVVSIEECKKLLHK